MALCTARSTWVNTRLDYTLVRRRKRVTELAENQSCNNSLGMLCKDMAQVRNLDAHERPPALIKNVYKFYQNISEAALKTDDGILDLSGGIRATFHDRISEVDGISSSRISAACRYLRDGKELAMDLLGSEVKVYEANNIPGICPGTGGSV